MLNYENAIVPDRVEDTSAVRRELGARVRATLAGGVEGASRLVRVAVPVDPVDPFTWLQAQPAAEKLYWSGRQASTAVAAVGTADLVTGTCSSIDVQTVEDALQARLARAGGVDARYFGGFAFDPAQRLEDGWQTFGTHRFVLPRFELRSGSGAATLACHLVLPRDAGRKDRILAQIERLVWPAPTGTGPLPSPVTRRDVPDRPAWRRMMAWALGAFAQNRLEKVVLARRSTFDFLDVLDPVALLQQLHAATANCFHFMVQPAEGLAFLGASPERLFRRSGDAVETEAVAGTRSRGDSARADAALLEELLESEKDRREHVFVEQVIRDRLVDLCTAVRQDETTSELRLTRGRHLCSRFEGRLRDDVTTLGLLRALHPTPAVGGVPTERACRAIRDREPFVRGWYAGPVGWMGTDAAEFAVAIRSGLVRGNRLTLYSGAGIVEGSRPEQEWDEIEQKISDFTAVLDVTPW